MATHGTNKKPHIFDGFHTHLTLVISGDIVESLLLALPHDVRLYKHIYIYIDIFYVLHYIHEYLRYIPIYSYGCLNPYLGVFSRCCGIGRCLTAELQLTAFGRQFRGRRFDLNKMCRGLLVSQMLVIFRITFGMIIRMTFHIFTPDFLEIFERTYQSSIPEFVAGKIYRTPFCGFLVSFNFHQYTVVIPLVIPSALQILSIAHPAHYIPLAVV